MEYIKVLWVHNHVDEPLWIYCELDENRMETRKVEVFADGTTGSADKVKEYGGSQLGYEPVPSLEEIAQDPQFIPSLIDANEFEEIWRKSRKETHR